MIITFRFHHDNRYTPAQIEQVQALWPEAKFVDHETFIEGNQYLKNTPHSDLMFLENRYIKFTGWAAAVFAIGVRLDDVDAVPERLVPGQPASQKALIEQRTQDAPLNHLTHVVVSGNMLMSVTQVEVLIDACTEQLAGRLSDGWRILAICPQPDQRRPDYVIGRQS